MNKQSILINKKAYYEYNILYKYISGIKLVGTEVKAIKNNSVSLKEAYCFIQEGEIYVRNMHISEYKRAGPYYNHKSVYDRKLLLKKKEIINLSNEVKRDGLTIIPLEIFINENGLIKIIIGLAKGKKIHDKRDAIKKRDLEKLEKNNI